MKILYIITQADGGGAQKYTLALAKHFNGSIAAGTEATKLFTDAKAVGITTFELKYLKRNIHPIYDLLALFELVNLIKKIQPNIVHLNSSKAGFLGSLVKPFVKAKIVFTAHGFIFNEPLSPFVKWVYLMLEKFASLFRDFIITVSDTDRKSALKNNLISPNKISTIHNGIGQITFLNPDEARLKLNLPKDKFVFGTLANFYKTKGQDVLIEAVSILGREVRTKLLFVLIGSGPELQNCKTKISSFGLENNFLLSGNLGNNANTLLKAFNVFILPSRKEGFPFVLLEAMQAGLSIITTNVGGNPEALGDAGILVAPENPNDLAAAITKLLANDDMQKNLSAKAVERSKLFTEEKMFSETDEVYKKLLQII